MGAIDKSYGHTDEKEYGNLMALTADGKYKGLLRGYATYDAASLADGAGTTTTVTVNGAQFNKTIDGVVGITDPVLGIAFGVTLAGITATGYVSADNTVSVRLQNESGGILDLASTTLSVWVMDVT